ncbi:MAG: CotH kinase family protein [Bacteroidota bacterium]
MTFILLLLLFKITHLQAQVNFPSQSDFQYLKGSLATDLPAIWMLPGFDDSHWSTGAAPFWYGDGNGGTLLDDMPNNYSTMYLRSSFECMNAEALSEVVFSINYDDGFILWINGKEVLSVNAPSSPLYNSFAPIGHESGSFEQFTVDTSVVELSEGINYLAVQGFNIGLTSSDFHFDVQINATPIFPGYPDTLGIHFDQPSGFYDAPFTCSVSTPAPGANIVYTLDGSNPQNSVTSFTSDSLANIYIDPESTSGRAQTPAVVLRASVVMEGYKPSKPRSRTFIFLEEVKKQDHPGGDWPVGSINGQTIDLEVDSRIITHPDYAASIDDAFREIPSISIITGNDNLFNPVTGIYVNARNDGVAWERECSVELVNPDGSDGFSVNAGLRIRGGFSRAPEFPKHSFRLLFKEVYGNAKLHFPLFGDEGVERFDNIDLRTAQNYAWSNGDGRNTMVKEVFSRDTQRDMGQPYTRSRYYHLYLNGMYWGLYQTQERSEADYAADYLGGNSGDYDVVKVEALIYDAIVTDGTLNSWIELHNKTVFGFADNESYFALEGKDENGDHIQGATTLVDIDNLIEYMLTIFYTGNMDAPVSEFLSNKHPNNFYGIYNRENKSEGYRFFSHDAEHTLLGVNDSRVGLAYRTDGRNMVVNAFKEFHPQWLHHKLTFNQEYMQRFSDKASLHLSPGGTLSPENALNRFNSRVSQIDTAIIAESARWGDARGRSESFTRDDNWLPEIQKIEHAYFPERTAVVMEQLRSVGLYSDMDAPVVGINGIPVQTLNYYFRDPLSISISNPTSVGVLCYATDGTDPREIGGSVSDSAVIFEERTESLLIKSTTILKARAYEYGVWGPLKQVRFLKSDEDFSSLKVTELHYHPLDSIIGPDTINGKKYEFIEFKNTGNEAIHLGGLVLDSAIYYEFSENEVLNPGAFYVVSSKTTKFYDRYGMKTSGNYEGYFSNDGEEVLLRDSAGNSIIHFIYNDQMPWPEMADGYGYSMVSAIRSPVDNPGQSEYWRHSVHTGGSPFADEPILANNHLLNSPATKVRLYPNPTSDRINVQVISDRQFEKIDIAIYSITGTLVYRETHPVKTTISLQQLHLKDGVYLIKVTGNGYSGSYRLIYSGGY